jgi:hypothetical protein
MVQRRLPEDPRFQDGGLGLVVKVKVKVEAGQHGRVTSK